MAGPLGMGFTIALAAVILLSGPVRDLQGAAKDQNKPLLNVRGITLPFYHGPENRLALLAKLDRITRENQRKAFFRIGVLPLMVAHDVRLEVRLPEHFASAIGAFHRHVAGKDLKRSAELRGFTLTVPANQLTLTATKVRIVSPDQWELTGPVRLAGAKATNEYSKATLLVSGKEAGTLQVPAGASYPLFPPRDNR